MNETLGGNILKGNEVITIIIAFAGIVGVLGAIFKTMVMSFIKQQEKITQAFLDSVNNSIIAQVQQTSVSRDVAENLRTLMVKACENGEAIKLVSDVVTHRRTENLEKER